MLYTGLVFKNLNGEIFANIIDHSENGTRIFLNRPMKLSNGLAYVDMESPEPNLPMRKVKCRGYLDAVRRMKGYDRNLAEHYEIQYQLSDSVRTKTGEPLIRAWVWEPVQPQRVRRKVQFGAASLR